MNISNIESLRMQVIHKNHQLTLLTFKILSTRIYSLNMKTLIAYKGKITHKIEKNN